MLSKLFVTGSIVLAASTAALAEPEPVAVAKLDAMVQAIKNAKTLSYTVNRHGEGAMFANFVPKTKTTVVAQRPPDNQALWMYQIKGRAELLTMTPVDYHVVADAARLMWLDHEAKVLNERSRFSTIPQQIDGAFEGAVRDILAPEPLAKDLKAPAITLGADMDVAGVPCSIVFVDYGENLPKIRWSIATSDNFPRKVERLTQHGGLNDSEVWELSDVKINQPVPEGSFAISTPAGYTFRSQIPATTPVVPRERAIGANLGDLAPDFELKDGEGKSVKLSELRGQVVVLDFWGTWCFPCKKASPELQKLTEDYKDKPVKVYGLACRETDDSKPIAYMKDNEYTYGLLLRADDVAKTYKVRVYPSYFVIGKDGEVAHVAAGYEETTFPQIRTAIDLALEGRSPTPRQAEQPKAPSGGGDDAADR